MCRLLCTCDVLYSSKYYKAGQVQASRALYKYLADIKKNEFVNNSVHIVICSYLWELAIVLFFVTY